MNAESRLNRVFENALELPLHINTKYVLMSDCHRGIGNSSDNFLKNQHLFFAALKYYYQNHFTYIELGDGDELWENKNYKNIIDMHSDVFWMFSRFYQEHRLYMLYGNHDIIKHKQSFSKMHCSTYDCENTQRKEPLFLELSFHEGIILRSKQHPQKALYLTHGHQASLLNSTFWPVAQWLVRYLWKPLESRGVNDPTSAAKNYQAKTKTEKILNNWATKHKHILVTGHTHRPVLMAASPYYCNTGSCVHPRCITCIEVENCTLTLVKWYMNAKKDGTFYVAREELAGPLQI